MSYSCQAPENRLRPRYGSPLPWRRLAEPALGRVMGFYGPRVLLLWLAVPRVKLQWRARAAELINLKL